MVQLKRGSVTWRSRLRPTLLLTGLTGAALAAPPGCATDDSEGGIAGPTVVTPPKDAQVEGPSTSDASDGPALTLCTGDQDCAGSPLGKYCNPASGQCAACSPSSTASCPAGFYCDPKALTCVVICTAGELHCECNELMQCDPGPPAKWIPSSPAVVCDANAGQACDAKTGACQVLTTTGGTTPTGTYYQYAVFTLDNSEFKGGCGLDADGDTLYVNRDGENLDVYTVTLEDTDQDGKLEPSQHPDNALAPGPMEKRTLKFVKTYTKTTDKVPLGVPWDTEIFVQLGGIATNGPTPNGSIGQYLFATQATTLVAAPTLSWSGDPLQIIGYGEKDHRFYAGDAYARRVYSFCEASKRWVAEFAFPSLAGDHFDGMEVVVDPKTQVQYVYVSDMQSDFLGQYRRDDSGGWVQENLFKYADGTGGDVEGMGFGALNHFWAANCGYPVGVTGKHVLYEIGGGDLDKYTTPLK